AYIDDFLGAPKEWEHTGFKKGFATCHIPNVGDVACFPPGVAGAGIDGHVAFVEAIGPQGIVVSETNLKGFGEISYRIIPDAIAFSAEVVYIAPKKLK
ncbi:MAG: CHAP domain-containing protein, partial [Streptococcaceae bacterium]|nr:CHAP domain-containing protein [Streptococcaceae bacterium]